MPQSQTAKRFALFFAVFIGICSIYMIGLGSSPLLDPDEPIYGQFIKEMVRSGNWLTPHYNGGLWFDKPPMIYWLAAICAKVFGLSEFTLRLPSAVFGALTVLMVFFLASHDFGKKTGILASAITGTTLLQIILVHAVATDAVMVFFMIAALYFYRRWLDYTGKSSVWWMAACGASTGLGMLTKGPAVPLLLLVTFIVHLLWTKQIKRLKSIDALVAVVIALLVGLPWYLIMLKMYGGLFVNQFILANNVTRFMKPLHKSHLTHWYSYLLTVVLFVFLFFPWNVFMLQAIRRYWSRNIGAKLMTCWIAVVLLFFSASSTQNFTYSFPAFPACAVLAGAYIAGLSDEHKDRKAFIKSLVIGFIVALLVAVALYITAGKKYPNMIGISILAGSVLILAYLIPLGAVLLSRISKSRAALMITSCMIVFNLIVVCVLVPAMAAYKCSREMARHIKSSPSVRVVSYDLWRPGLFYYLDTKPADVKDPKEIKRLTESPEPLMIVCSSNKYDEIKQPALTLLFSDGGLDAYANQAYLKTYNSSQINR